MSAPDRAGSPRSEAVAIHPAHAGHELRCASYGCLNPTDLADGHFFAHAVRCITCHCWADEHPEAWRRRHQATTAAAPAGEAEPTDLLELLDQQGVDGQPLIDEVPC